MQRVNLDRGKFQVAYHLGGMLEIFHGFAGEAHDDVRGDGKSRRLAALDGVRELGEGMPAVDGGKCQVVCGLQADFYDNRLFAIEFREVGDLVVLEAVRARADREARNLLMLDNRIDDSLQVLQRRMRIRIRLQVGQDACVRVLFAEPRHELVELFLNRDLRLVKYRAKAAVVAIAATRKTLGTVQVRATHAAV